MRHAGRDTDLDDSADATDARAPFLEAGGLALVLMALKGVIHGIDAQALVTVFGIFCGLVTGLSLTGRWALYSWDEVQMSFGPWPVDKHPMAAKFVQWGGLAIALGLIYSLFTTPP